MKATPETDKKGYPKSWMWFVHPISMCTAYIDNNTSRDPFFALAPKPDTIGHFSTEFEAFEWCRIHNLVIVEPAFTKGME